MKNVRDSTSRNTARKATSSSKVMPDEDGSQAVTRWLLEPSRLIKTSFLSFACQFKKVIAELTESTATVSHFASPQCGQTAR